MKGMLALLVSLWLMACHNVYITLLVILGNHFICKHWRLAILLSLLLFVCFLFLRMPCSAHLLPHWEIHQPPRLPSILSIKKHPQQNTRRSWQRLSKYIASVRHTHTDFQIKTAHCDPENNVKSLCGNKKKPALQQQRLAQECWSHRGLNVGPAVL